MKLVTARFHAHGPGYDLLNDHNPVPETKTSSLEGDAAGER